MPAARVALWGTFDVDNYGDHLFPRLAAAHHLVVVGGGELIHLHDPLLAAVYGTSTDELHRMAPSRFFVEGLGPELEADCPVVWHAVGVPWAPDEEQAERLRGALA